MGGMTIVSWMSSTTAGTSMGSILKGPMLTSSWMSNSDMPGISI
ncbi:Uncharacterised protein [Mycobacterium tuberculosis]|nr:Uncharacterised protein [Mycobacterium tuberculosis]CFA21720.1 Uncharacterised protein [Mycobacterium tuberculosis]CFA28272.1 Uncharacterised protein [Mycobacterium tuberculosis]CFB15431.1 Uncharacterised protein [Mycobacterium tuberculosis]CFC71530.1 Uncharacterised protein [Mycobacterium tuberculosis]